MRRTRANAPAFTLLEMLAALALMGLLATALSMSLSTGLRTRSRAEAAIGPTRAAALALDLLKQDLESAPPPRGILAGAFVGVDAKAEGSSEDGDTLVFCSAAENPGRMSVGIRKIELALVADEAGAGMTLKRRVTDNLLAQQTPTPTEETLCRNVAALNLRYFDGAAWQDAWDSTTAGNRLPVAVEAALTVRAPGRTLDGNATCKLTRLIALPCGVAAADASSQ
jgi:type II secretion system protein J